MKVAFHTLGCKVNQYETEAMREAFAARGAELASEDEAADVYIINTCTVTNMADRKSRQYVRRMKSLNPAALMVVTGCYAQVAAEELEKMEDVDLVVGNNLKGKICDMVFRMLGEEPLPAVKSAVLAYDELDGYEDLGIVTSDESSMSRAYIKIEEGCNRFCSYCLIPFARGRVRSRKPEEIVEEAALLIEKGYREVILTGINTALYGTEPEFAFERLGDEEGLSGLEVIIKRLDALDADFRIRLSSLEPTVVDKNDVERLLAYDKLCHHLHLSIQSGSDHVLGLMNRHYTAEEYLGIVAALKAFDPCYGITTDIIAGFPEETEQDHSETLELVERAGFGRVHVFRYSPRKGTKAAEMSGQVDGAVKARRSEELMEAAERAAAAFVELNKGVRRRMLAEERDGDFVTGYTDNYIKVYVEDRAREMKIGEFCDVVVEELFRDGALAAKAHLSA